MNHLGFLVVFVAFAALLPAQDGPAPVALAIEPGAPIEVGAVRLNTGFWQPVDGDWCRARAFGEHSWHGSATVQGRVVHLFTEGDDVAAPWPLWRGCDDGTLAACEPLQFRATGPLAMARGRVAGLDLGITVVRSGPDQISATLDHSRAFHAKFDVAGQPQLAVFVDGDFDGVLSAGDYWIAGPAALVGKLRFPNPQYELRRLDAGWCLGDASLWLTGIAAGRPAVEVRAGGRRTELREQHAARDDAEFLAKWTQTRAQYLAELGDAGDRPATEAPRAWHHAQDLAEAVAWAQAQGRPLLVEYTSRSCPYCKLLQWAALRDREVDAALAAFACVRIVVELDASKPFAELGHGVPCTKRIDADGREIARLLGSVAPSKYLAFLREAAR